MFLLLPLDLTVNGFCKKFLKGKFSDWYSSQVSKQLASNIPLGDVKVKLQLTTLKPLQAIYARKEFVSELNSLSE